MSKRGSDQFKRPEIPMRGLSVLIEFFARIGLVEQLENRQFYQPESPNHYDPGQILVGFMLSVIRASTPTTS